MFSVFFLVGAVVTGQWKMVPGAAGVLCAAIALGRHPRMVLFVAIGTLAVGPFTFGGRIRTMHALETGQWLLTLGIVAGCLVVMFLLSRLVKPHDWQYGPATRSDKIVVAGIFASIPIGLALLLWYLNNHGLS